MEGLFQDNQVDCETRIKIHKLCGEYLGMKWQNVDADDLTIKRIRQGRMNAIYLCELPSSSSEDGDSSSPSCVVMKLLSEITQASSENLIEATICYLMAGMKGFGPKILGVFPDGFICEYFGTRNYAKCDDFNDSSVKLLATKLAQLHALPIPIHKDYTKKWHKLFFEDFMTKDYLSELINVKLPLAIKCAGTDTYIMYDLIKESEAMEKAIKELNSPLVMAHTDFHRGNILVKENCGQNGESIDRPIDIKFVDFDGSGFMYRGLDLGKYFSEWRVEHEPLIAILDRFPSDDQMNLFLSAYRTEYGRQFGDEWLKDERNSIETLRKESKLFVLFAHLLDIAFCLWLASEENDLDQQKTTLKIGDARFAGYIQLKQKFLLEGSVIL